MSFDEFRQAAAHGAPVPAGLSSALRGLWHDFAGDWAKAHTSVQDDSGPDAAWVHAYLHRKEGDAANAAYWYRRAGKPGPAPTVSLDAERDNLLRALLAR